LHKKNLRKLQPLPDGSKAANPIGGTPDRRGTLKDNKDIPKREQRETNLVTQRLETWKAQFRKGEKIQKKEECEPGICQGESRIG